MADDGLLTDEQLAEWSEHFKVCEEPKTLRNAQCISLSKATQPVSALVGFIFND